MSDQPAGPAQPTAPPAPTLLELFIAFAIISLSGFGGVLAWSRRMLVDERKWMTPEEFNDAYALCQFLPGPNIVNLSVVFGRSIRGVPGSVVALIGLIGPGAAIVTFFGFLYSVFGDIDALQRMFSGVAAAAAGLMISTTAKIADPLVRGRLGPAHAVAIATFAAIGMLRWPLWVLAILVPLSIALAWWGRR